MLRTTAVALLLLAALPARADDQATDELRQALRTLNDAFAKPDAAAVRRLMTDDHEAVTPYYGVPATKEEQLRTLPDLKLSEYKPGKETIRMVHRDVAIIAYPLTMKGTFKGKPVAAKSYAVAVWVRHGGHWQEASYQETALDGK